MDVKEKIRQITKQMRNTEDERDRLEGELGKFNSRLDKLKVKLLKLEKMDAKKMRKVLLENLIVEARKTPYPFGIEIKQHNLIREEKRWLADKGLHLHGPGRHKSMILVYPQELRIRDIKEKVYKKRRQNEKIRNE